MSLHDHRPVTRREFIARSSKYFSVTALAPTALYGMLSATAARAGVTESEIEADGAIPFLVFDMAGGGSLPGNFLVGNKGGPQDLLTSYDTHGWDPKAADALDMQFGLPMSKRYSKILQGINERASADARSRLRFSSICHFAQDDSSGNAHSAAALVSMAGGRGNIVKNTLGLLKTRSGGNSQNAFEGVATSPLVVSKIDDILDAVRFQSVLKSLPKKAIAAFASAAKDLSLIQLKNLGTQYADLGKLHAGFFDQAAMGNDASALLDPRQNTSAQGVYALNPNSSATARDTIFGGIVMGTLTGNTGPGILTFGGCDYHTGEQTAGDNKDLEVGREIGKSIELAHRLQKPLFIQLLTDGGTDSRPGTRNWSGDSGIRSMTIMGYYDPKGPKKQVRLQVGNYTNGQGADLTTVVGQDRTKVASAVFANYLSVIGKFSQFDRIMPQRVFTPAELDSVVCFDPTVT